jgi:hypothetical protein
MGVIVENKRTYKGGSGMAVYVGRPSLFGNPAQMRDEADRDRVIEFYRKWLRSKWSEDGPVKRELLKLAKIAKDRDIVLLCWCAPKPCHAHVLKEAIEGVIAKNLV